MNNLFGVFARVWKIKEKGFWEKSLFELHHLDFYNFPRIFFELLISIPLVFSTLELNLLSYSIGSLCGKRDCLWLFVSPPSCKPIHLLAFVPFPHCVEEVVLLGCIPQVMR